MYLFPSRSDNKPQKQLHRAAWRGRVNTCLKNQIGRKTYRSQGGMIMPQAMMHPPEPPSTGSRMSTRTSSSASLGARWKRMEVKRSITPVIEGGESVEFWLSFPSAVVDTVAWGSVSTVPSSTPIYVVVASSRAKAMFDEIQAQMVAFLQCCRDQWPLTIRVDHQRSQFRRSYLVCTRPRHSARLAEQGGPIQSLAASFRAPTNTEVIACFNTVHLDQSNLYQRSMAPAKWSGDTGCY